MRIKRLLPSGKPAKVNAPNFSEVEVYTGSWLLLHGYFPASVCAHFFKRDFLLRSGIQFLTDIMHEDVDFQLKLFAHIKRFMFCHVYVYTYYYNPKSTDRLMDINKQKRSILSDLQICKNLVDFSLNESLSDKLKSFYIRRSNSQLIGLCLHLANNSDLSYEFKRQFMCKAYQMHLFPIKGACSSWKTYILKFIINNFAYIYDRVYK